MKSKILLMTLVCLSINTAHSFSMNDLMTPKVQKMILPCAAGMILGQALGQEMGVGLAICGASVTYSMVNDYHENKESQVLQDTEKFLREAKVSLDTHMKTTKEEYFIYQEAVRKIILEKLSEIQTASENQIEVYMKTPAFEAFLKKKTEEILSSSDDVFENKLRSAKEEIRRQVTEDVLKDVLDSQVVQ